MDQNEAMQAQMRIQLELNRLRQEQLLLMSHMLASGQVPADKLPDLQGTVGQNLQSTHRLLEQSQMQTLQLPMNTGPWQLQNKDMWTSIPQNIVTSRPQAVNNPMLAALQPINSSSRITPSQQETAVVGSTTKPLNSSFLSVLPKNPTSANVLHHMQARRTQKAPLPSELPPPRESPKMAPQMVKPVRQFENDSATRVNNSARCDPIKLVSKSAVLERATQRILQQGKQQELTRLDPDKICTSRNGNPDIPQLPTLSSENEFPSNPALNFNASAVRTHDNSSNSASNPVNNIKVSPNRAPIGTARKSTGSKAKGKNANGISPPATPNIQKQPEKTETPTSSAATKSNIFQIDDKMHDPRTYFRPEDVTPEVKKNLQMLHSFLIAIGQLEPALKDIRLPEDLHPSRDYTVIRKPDGNGEVVVLSSDDERINDEMNDTQPNTPIADVREHDGGTTPSSTTSDYRELQVNPFIVARTEYKCLWESCNAYLNNLEFLEKHISVRHCRDANRDPQTGEYHCHWPPCQGDRGFSTKKNIMMHIVKKHLRPLERVCLAQGCGKVFDKYDLTMQHMAEEHPELMVPSNGLMPDYLVSTPIAVPQPWTTQEKAKFERKLQRRPEQSIIPTFDRSLYGGEFPDFDTDSKSWPADDELTRIKRVGPPRGGPRDIIAGTNFQPLGKTYFWRDFSIEQSNITVRNIAVERAIVEGAAGRTTGAYPLRDIPRSGSIQLSGKDSDMSEKSGQHLPTLSRQRLADMTERVMSQPSSSPLSRTNFERSNSAQDSEVDELESDDSDKDVESMMQGLEMHAEDQVDELEEDDNKDV